ncbi:hypothetical protein PF011_g666 [Phytophthora fragariae]|uniref:Reverse transcriptase RNase H-like domain-containing protein n=1 Tax=Phytophthora fragariae TaxID=53985 RepID=A0A6A3MKX0_9STRA|nr:hypothetical protein PF011_g666 [Phytophthora fragariae]
MVPLVHPSPTAEVCLYVDASQDYWGAVVTQIDPSELQVTLEKQNHRPLVSLSGRFAGASSRWDTIETEAFAIVESTSRLEYLLLRPREFHLYIDHRNLVYMFDPYGSDGTMAKYRADKSQRWALSLMSFKYVIEHVPGEVNAWGDLPSRWGAGPALPLSRPRDAWPDWPSSIESPRCKKLSLCGRLKPRLELFIKTPSTRGKQELPV